MNLCQNNVSVFNSIILHFAKLYLLNSYLTCIQYIQESYLKGERNTKKLSTLEHCKLVVDQSQQEYHIKDKT